MSKKKEICECCGHDERFIEYKNCNGMDYKFCFYCGELNFINEDGSYSLYNKGTKDENEVKCSTCKTKSYCYHSLEYNNLLVNYKSCLHCKEISLLLDGSYLLYNKGTIGFKSKVHSYFIRAFEKVKFSFVYDFFANRPLFTKGIFAVLSVLFIYHLTSYVFAITIIPLLLAHEYGHIIAMNNIGMKQNGMIMIPGLGMAAMAGEEIKIGKNELYIAAAGPIVGLVVISVILCAHLISPSPLYLGIAVIGSLIHLFNLLPIAPLDGGRIIRSSSYLINGIFGKVLCVVGYVLCIFILSYLNVWVLLSIVGLFGWVELKQDKIPVKNKSYGIFGFSLYASLMYIFIEIINVTLDSEVKFIIEHILFN